MGDLIKGLGDSSLLQAFGDPSFSKFTGGLATAATQDLAGRVALSRGQAIQAGRRLTADSLRARAGGERAIGQRQGVEIGRRGRTVESDLIAAVAAGGGGGDDPGVAKLAGDIAAETDFRRRSARAGGDIRAAGLERAADLREFEGAEALRVGKIIRKSKRRAAFGSLLGSLGNFSFLEKFGESDDDFMNIGAFGNNPGSNFGLTEDDQASFFF